MIPYLGGHGIGSFFHGPPDIYHVLNNYFGAMKPGMVFTVEPCVAEGDHRIRQGGSIEHFLIRLERSSTHCSVMSDGWSLVSPLFFALALFER